MLVEQIIDGIIVREGGYVNDPKDSGGPTKYGITQKRLAEYLRRPVALKEIINLDVALARQIYREEYINRPRINLLPEPPQVIVADMGVLHGTTKAVKMLQEVLKLLGHDPGIVDGEIGSKTIQACKDATKKLGAKALQNAVVDRRIRYVEDIVKRRPDQKKFLRGWKNRAEMFRLR